MSYIAGLCEKCFVHSVTVRTPCAEKGTSCAQNPDAKYTLPIVTDRGFHEKGHCGVRRRPGLGLGVARYYAQKGYRIALLARSVDHLSNLQNMLIAEGHEAESFRVDLADRDSIVGAIEAVKRAYGRIDAIHYSPNDNGGFIQPTPSIQMTCCTPYKSCSSVW